MRDGRKEGETLWEEETETKGRTGRVGVSEGEESSSASNGETDRETDGRLDAFTAATPSSCRRTHPQQGAAVGS